MPRGYAREPANGLLEIGVVHDCVAAVPLSVL